MTPDELRKAVYERFHANWTETTFVHYEGMPFKEPGVDIPWVRISVQDTGSIQASLGGVGTRKYDRDFSIFIQVFTPLTGGMQSGSILAQAARAIFEGVRLDPEAWLYEGSITQIPIRDGMKSRQQNIEITGTYLEIK